MEVFNRQKNRPTGIVCLNDLVAFGALAALSTMGLKAGRDVAVVGVDDSDEAAACAPPLTTVSNKSNELASAAIRLLRERQHAPLAPPKGVKLSPNLIIRESCGAQIW
jgi:LacI family transcriptional regulator